MAPLTSALEGVERDPSIDRIRGSLGFPLSAHTGLGACVVITA